MRLLPFALALAPLFPPLALLAPLFLGHLRRLSPWALGLLGAYALSILLPALWAPEALALPLALGRVLYVLGLVGVGVALYHRTPTPSQELTPLGYGLLFLYGSALLASYLAFGDKVVDQRLMHPFHSPVGLGLMGALGVLLALYLRYPPPIRLLLGLLGGAVLLLSGSRGGMLALLLGGAGGLLFRGRGVWALGVAGLLLFLASLWENPVTGRFLDAHLSGRETLWLQAYEVFRAHPWTGVGPYLLGDYLKGSLLGNCFLFPLLEARGLSCPSWLVPFGGFWTFAHNHLLQALGEGGLFGALGLLLLAGGFLAAAFGEGLLFPLLLAYLAMGMVDNPFSVPSPFRGEVFFLVGGMALARGVRLPRALALAGAVGVLWSLPFLYLATRPPTPPPALVYLAFPKEGVGFLRLVGAQGYRVQVWLCQKDCQRVGWEWRGDEPMYFPLPQDLPKGEYRLRVLLLSQHRLALRPRYVLEKEVRW
ncbi:O-antigen ligase family protein [Thermus scotoductus]|uniref:O-antigen polymerase family n=1 Tax=Thermus scotoductus (strain ATCC 700910 / SA-01) TaxID=743525 RepID=E8PKF4_THESS|nr:O-antigen ligase family protein [Thermus scotoductus]ADW20926.1 O-antigen polymerase family [Thermus scotoductus SA-01]